MLKCSGLYLCVLKHNFQVYFDTFLSKESPMLLSYAKRNCMPHFETDTFVICQSSYSVFFSGHTVFYNLQEVGSPALVLCPLVLCPHFLTIAIVWASDVHLGNANISIHSQHSKLDNLYCKYVLCIQVYMCMTFTVSEVLSTWLDSSILSIKSQSKWGSFCWLFTLKVG